MKFLDRKNMQVVDVDDSDASAIQQAQAAGFESPDAPADPHSGVFHNILESIAPSSEEERKAHSLNATTVAEGAPAALLAGAGAVARGVLGDTGAQAGLVSEQSGKVDAQGNPVAFGGADLAPKLFSDYAQKRAENPFSAGVGEALGAAPLYAAGGLPGILAGDALQASTQEAVDAEMENRGINGSHILRNGALNLLFSGAAHVAGAAAVRALGWAGDLFDNAAGSASKFKSTGAAALTPEELAKAGTPEARADLGAQLQQRVSDTASRAADQLDSLKPPKVANNPNAQRAALSDLGDLLDKSDPTTAKVLEELQGGTVQGRFEGLSELRGTVDPESDAGKALDNLLNREDLWGADAIGHATDVEAAKGLQPGPDADPSAVRAYADAVRKLRGGTLAGVADELDGLADHSAQTRLASSLTQDGPLPKGPIDYHAAADSMTPGEAWQLKAGGGTDALRKTESYAAKSSFEGLETGLQNDLNVGAKYEDFAAAAKNWTPEQIAEQSKWTDHLFTRATELDQLARDSSGASPKSGYNLKGFARSLSEGLNASMTRIAGADPVARNYELDVLKRFLQRQVQNIGGAGRSLDAEAMKFGQRVVNSLAEELRLGLEDPAKFGANAELQVPVNKAFKRMIDPLGRVRDAFSDVLGRRYAESGSGAIERRYDASAINKRFSDFELDDRKDLMNALGGADDLAKAFQEKGLEVPAGVGETRKHIQRILDAQSMFDVLDKADRVGKPGLLEGLAHRAVSHRAATIVGGIVGHIPGAALGEVAHRAASAALEHSAATRALVAPGSDSEFAQAIRKHLTLAGQESPDLVANPRFVQELHPAAQRAIAAAGDGAADRVVQQASAAKASAELQHKVTARTMVDPEAAQRFARVAGSAAAGGALESFQGDHETFTSAYDQHVASVKAFQQNPQALIDVLQSFMGNAQDMSPKLAAEIQIQAFKVNSFLQAHFPGQRNVSAVYPNGTPTGSAEQRQFALFYSAALDPQSVLADARAGKVRQEQVATLRELWPDEYTGLRTEVIQQLGSGKATAATRTRLNALFQLGKMGADPAMSPFVSALVAQGRAKRAPPGASKMTARSAPSKAGLTAGGMSALQLGPALDARQ